MRSKHSTKTHQIDSFQKSEEYKLVDKILKRFQKKSYEEQLESFVEVGIYNENGELTQRYGGSAPEKEK